MTTKEDILAKRDRTYAPIEGHDGLFVQSLTALEVDRIDSVLVGEGGQLDQRAALDWQTHLIIACVVDEIHVRVFEAEDFDALQEIQNSVFNELVQAAQDHNQKKKSLPKTSGTTPADSSPIKLLGT